MSSLVSIIIPVFNVAPFLREALDSVINQTYENLEIIVIDDGSTDDSPNICDYYSSDPRVKIIHQKNKGLSGARNVGLDVMTGDYVSFLDSDDAYKPDMIERMVEKIESCNCELVACGYENIITNQRLDAPGRRRKACFSFVREEILTSKEAQRRVLTGRMRINVWSKLYKKEIWSTLRFPEGHVYEDNHVVFQVLEKCKNVLTVPQRFILHRERDGSIMATQSYINMKDRVLAEKVMAEYIASHTPDIFSDRTLSMYLEGQARKLSIQYADYLYQKKPKEMVELFRTEALESWETLKEKSITNKSKVIKFLFLYFPFALLPIESVKRLEIMVVDRNNG